MPIIAHPLFATRYRTAPATLATGCVTHLRQPLFIANHRALSRAVIVDLLDSSFRYPDVTLPAWT